jgi:hypothetical protein
MSHKLKSIAMMQTKSKATLNLKVLVRKEKTKKYEHDLPHLH